MTTTTDTRFDLASAAKTAARLAVPARLGLAVPARLGIGVLGTISAAFAFLAFWDLAIRDKRTVKGPKPVWIPVILVNWVGPAVYFLFGIKR